MTAQEYLRKPYSRILIPNEEGGYSAELLEFPGCVAQGETTDEAYKNLEDAAESWIEACQETNQEIPEPFINQGFGGKIALRLPRSLHRQAARLAERDGVSLNQYLVAAVAGKVGEDDAYHRMLQQTETHLGSPVRIYMNNLAFNNVQVTFATTGEGTSLGAGNAGNITGITGSVLLNAGLNPSELAVARG